MKRQKNKNQGKVVFLDRDGTLTKRHELTWKKSQIRLQDGVARFICFLNSKKIPVIVITNQSVVARGLISENAVKKIHVFLDKRLKKHGGYIDRFYFCPHHPEASVPKYRKKCLCRKPGVGLFLKAKKDFSINFKRSFTIGDMTQDILAGHKAGTKTILLKKGCKGLDGKYETVPDFEVKNFNQVLKIFKKNEFF